MTPLNLSVPEQHAYTDPTVERNVERLRGWLTSLPLMDVVETVRLVGNALDALNEQQLDIRFRFDSLEAFHATAQRLFITVDPLRLSQLSLSKSQRQQAIEGVERLLLSLAGGYKLVVMTLYEAHVSGQGDRLFGEAVNRSIEALVYTLLDCYRFYRAMQPRYLSELHQLYRLARYHGLLNVKIDDDENDDSVTTAALYHTAMLSSLVDPFRLAEGEISLLFDVLLRHTSRCRIIPGTCQPGGEEGLYQLDLGSDAGPFACVEHESSVAVKEAYILDAREVLKSVHEQLVKIPDKVRTLSPEATLLRQLLPEDPQEKMRREERRSDERRMQVLLGIDDIHAFLMQVSSNKSAGKTTRDAEQPAVESIRCRVLDSSDNGMRLSWDNSAAGDVRVGELLAVVEGQPGQQYLQLAMVRSVRVYREGAMEAGVQLIKGGVGAVYCHVLDDPESAGSIALFMPSSGEEQGAATLIASKDIYTEGCHIVIDVADKEVRARAGRRIFEGPVFDRFEFSAE
jgi:hypothetical protein